jgi:hypothetical protein
MVMIEKVVQYLHHRSKQKILFWSRQESSNGLIKCWSIWLAEIRIKKMLQNGSAITWEKAMMPLFRITWFTIGPKFG